MISASLGAITDSTIGGTTNWKNNTHNWVMTIMTDSTTSIMWANNSLPPTKAYNSYHVTGALARVLDIPLGREMTINLPDKTVIEIKANGSFEIQDDKAEVVYKANRVREFNRYVNASDLLEAFVRFCGKEAGVRQGEILDLPIKLFIGWLVLEAAKADKEPEPEIKLLPDLRRAGLPRCRSCGRFMRFVVKRGGFEHCSIPCFERGMKKVVGNG